MNIQEVIKMNNLKEYSKDKVIELIKENQISVTDFVDQGICSTCFDKENNHILYGDNGNLRAEGHTIISTKNHFKDMLEIDDDTCKEYIGQQKKLMNILKETYNSESVYLCTMCDGSMNHFHIQLIPRFSDD